MNAVALTRDLLRYDTINPPGEEQACARRVGRLLEDDGFSVAEHEFGPLRTSLVARLGGRGDMPPLCFSGHLDVVPLGTRPWTREPFARARSLRSTSSACVASETTTPSPEHTGQRFVRISRGPSVTFWRVISTSPRGEISTT